MRRLKARENLTVILVLVAAEQLDGDGAIAEGAEGDDGSGGRIRYVGAGAFLFEDLVLHRGGFHGPDERQRATAMDSTEALRNSLLGWKVGSKPARREVKACGSSSWRTMLRASIPSHVGL